MFICLCNGLTDGQIRAVCQNRPERVSDIYKALGCAAKCGKCIPLMKELSRIESPVTTFAEATA